MASCTGRLMACNRSSRACCSPSPPERSHLLSCVYSSSRPSVLPVSPFPRGTRAPQSVVIRIHSLVDLDESGQKPPRRLDRHPRIDTMHRFTRGLAACLLSLALGLPATAVGQTSVPRTGHTNDSEKED